MSKLRTLSVIGTSLLLASSISGCDLRFDTDEAAAPMLSLAQVARYRATSCVDALESASQLEIPSDKITAWHQLVGPNWHSSPESNRHSPSASSSENEAAASAADKPGQAAPEKSDSKAASASNTADKAAVTSRANLPNPFPLPEGNTLTEHLETGRKCALTLQQDAYQLSKIAHLGGNKGFAEEIFSGTPEQMRQLAQTLLAVSASMDTQLGQVAQKAGVALPAPETSPVLPLRYQNSRWKTLTEATAQLQKTLDKAGKEAQENELSSEEKEKLNELVLKIDALRFSLESYFASNPDLALKQLVANQLSPLMRAQSQQLVSLSGSDPRQARYERVSLSGENYLVEVLRLYQGIQQEILLSVPEPKDYDLGKQLNLINQALLAIGADPGVAPGLSLEN